MKLQDIPFEDEAFKKAVLATGETEAEAVTAINGRKQSIRSAKGIEYFPNLERLDLTRNQLECIDLSQNPKIQQLFLGNNQLEELDTSALSALEGLEIFMNDLSELDLSKNPELEVLYANANDFSSMDLSSNKSLIEVQLSDNSLKSLSLSDEANYDVFEAKENLFSDDIKQSLQSSVKGCSIRL